MRLNKYIASKTGLSRRHADYLIDRGLVLINNEVATLGQKLTDSDQIEFSDPETNQHYSLAVDLNSKTQTTTIILNKPVGYVCSRDGQGSDTVYDLLPKDFASLKIAGRLDKDSSGLVLLSDDGELINELTHPKYQKTKVYDVQLDQPLEPLHQQIITDTGISLDDGLSKFVIEKIADSAKNIRITMHEGRNRQIRRTFEALGYKIAKLHRTNLGSYQLKNLMTGRHKIIN
ncbi:MAG: pseudouridine synthase [Patescibacteria group bacterium]